MNNGGPPTGASATLPWYPPNLNTLPAYASINSPDFVVSQIPLPNHLPVDYQGYESGSDYSSPLVPQQAWSQTPYFPCQPQMMAHPSPLNPSPVYPMQPQMGQGYLGMNGIQGQPFGGHPQLSQMPHNYQSEVSCNSDYLQQNQPMYYGDQFIPPMMNYQPESVLHDQQDGFQQIQDRGVRFPDLPDNVAQNGYGIQQHPYMPYQQTHGMNYHGMAGYDHQANFSQQYGPPNMPKNNYVPPGFNDRRGSWNNGNSSWVNENQGFVQNRPRGGAGFGNRGQMRNVHPSARGYGTRAPSNNVQSGPALGRTLSLNEPRSRDFRGRGKSYNPRYVSAGFDKKEPQNLPAPVSAQDLEPVKLLPQSHPTPVGPLNDNIILTPNKVAITSPSKKPTPATARKFGEATPNVSPVLRSRRHQSVAEASLTFKIDPLKGPPPTFWPGGEQPLTMNEELSPRSKVTRTRSSTGVLGLGTDPFMSPSTLNEISSQPMVPPPSASRTREPQDMVMPASSTLAIVNPLRQTQSPSDNLGALLLSTQPQPTGPSQHLSFICPNGVKPSIDVAFDPQNMPFVEPARVYHGALLTGVVRISNIPYAVTRQEIIAFLGRNARLVSEAEEPIHIIMERATSKTMDAYVEFVTFTEAVNSVNRYETNRAGGRGGRLGERHVDLEVVGHEQLMKDLFPKAKSVVWNGSEPEILMMDMCDPYHSGFQGFVTREELVMLSKHVEAPHRSPFSRDCGQRPYECLISTLVKYPWHMVDFITLEDRDMIFKTTRDLVVMLQARINNATVEDLQVNPRLLRRVQRAVFNCPGFSESQKDDIAFICGIDPPSVELPPYADHWTVFHAIGAKRGWEIDVIQYYQALVREATTSAALVTLAERSANGDNATNNVFGNINIIYPMPVNEMTLADIGRVEWDAIEALLRKVLA